jgi:hypothetical protein
MLSYLRLAWQRDSGDQPLCDLALDDCLAGLNGPAQNSLLERGHNLSRLEIGWISLNDFPLIMCSFPCLILDSARIIHPRSKENKIIL